jgi:hypothetical protein
MSDLPPPGWYDDPTSPVQERWWDGERWSEQSRRKVIQEKPRAPGQLRDAGDFLGHSFRLIGARWDELLLLSVAAGLLLAVAATALVRPVISEIDVVSGEILGGKAVHLFWLAAFVALAFAISLAAAMGLYRLTWDAAGDRQTGWAGAVRYGVASAPRLFGWMVVGVLPMLGLGIAFALVAAAAEGLSVLLGIAVLGALIWWAVVLGFVPVALVVREGENPIRVALAVVKGRWWKVFGRLLLMTIVAGLILNVVGAIISRLLGGSVFGLEIIDRGNGDLDLVKNLTGHLEFFLTNAVLLSYSMASNVPYIAGITSVAGDAMLPPGAERRPSEL